MSAPETGDYPVRLCCGRRHGGVQCPDGLVMCCLCFGRFPVEELAVDPTSGQKEDVCSRCAESERTCRTCGGDGYAPMTQTGCPTCQGTGHV
jgi:hypothetical protein